jgi:hypothetical protein
MERSTQTWAISGSLLGGKTAAVDDKKFTTHLEE